MFQHLESYEFIRWWFLQAMHGVDAITAHMVVVVLPLLLLPPLLLPRLLLKDLDREPWG